MRIAVALCTHQGERFLAEQLESIAAQSRLPDEVVIGDDRSTDATVGIIERFSGAVPFPVRLLLTPDRLGTAKNFERVIAACFSASHVAAGIDGETDGVIVLADQDDVWHPEKLAAMEAAFSAPARPGLAFSDGALIDKESIPVGGSCWTLVRLSSEEIRRIDAGDGFQVLLERQLTLGGTVTGATMAFRAEHRPRVLPLPDWLPTWGKAALIHDAWIALIVAAAAPVSALPRPLVRYRLHGDQQVGLVARPPVSRVRVAGVALRSLWAPEEGPRLKEAEVQWLRALLERLQSTSPPTGAETHIADAVALVEGRLAHFMVRASLPITRLRRIGPIAAELATGRYGRYSSGPLSAARDLLQP